MAPLSAAERQRRSRARRDSDPEKRQTYLESERQRWKQDVEQGKKKKISDLNERGKRQQRKKWRKQNKKRKEAKKEAEARTHSVDTPPQSPDPVPQPEQPSGSSRQREVGNRISRKNRDRLRKEIEKLKKSLENERKRSDKYRKRYKRLNKTESPRSKVNELTKTGRVNSRIRKTLLYHEALIKDIRNKYAKARKEKQLISKVTVGRIVKKYRLQGFAEKALGFSKKRRSVQSENLCTTNRHPTNRFSTAFKSKVKIFFTRDDVSRITTGRKQTITRNKVKKQKRFLVDTMKNLHKKFLAENTNNISYSLFCKLRPFWVVHPTLSDRNTCLCKIHENLGFVVEKLHHLRLIDTTDLHSLTEKITCDTSSKMCMYDECVECKDKTVQLSSFDGLAKVAFTQWATAEKEREDAREGPTTVKITVKKTTEDILDNLVELFHTLLHKFKRHAFNINQQYSYCRELKKNMSKEEAVIHIDFSENYTCKYGSEIQAVHFGSSHQQATLHTGVLYIGGEKEPICFCTVSPSKQKSPPAIWEHMNPVLDYLQATYPQVSVLHFLSDGPCTQYKQKGNFFLFSTELARRGLKGGTWNFFEASHGKGAPDGVGGTLKRTADKLVTNGRDIPDAHELYKALTETSTTVKLFYVASQAVEQAVERMPGQILPVPSTMKTHQVVTVTRGEILYREVSCMCSTQKQLSCQCFNTQHFTFNKPAQKVPATEAISWESGALIGKWCVLKYDNDLYPGIILYTDETHAQVKCMHRVGANRFYWPPRDDILWYLFDDVLEIIQAPQSVTSRHVEIQRDVWKRLSESL